MKLHNGLGVVAALALGATSQSVVGEVAGFAAGVTGGGDASPDFPTSTDELLSMLTDDEPRVIVLEQTFDFTETEGTTTGNICYSWGTDEACQAIISDDCSEQGTWYTAGQNGIEVASNKTVIGTGSDGVIKGKGLRFTGGVSNIIVQNIAVIEINNKYVWGGDAIAFSGSDLIWIDHVTTNMPGRQHYCFGFDPSTRITLSNNYINGTSTYSTGCDGYHYWVFEMVGEDDQITMRNNYIYHTSGRGPALSGSTLLHAVNNVWEDIAGHALEGGEPTARGIFEGNAFIDVNQVISDYAGELFGAPTDQLSSCSDALGRDCVANSYRDSDGTLGDYADTGFFAEFSGLTIADANSADEAESAVPGSAGFGHV